MLTYSRKALLIALLILPYAAPAEAADIKTLMEIGASQAEIAKSLQRETKSYDAIKKAINSGDIKEGMAANTIRGKYGDPVIEASDKDRDLAKWLYMPASSGHFSGEKLYIYMDSDNKVKDWKIVEH